MVEIYKNKREKTYHHLLFPCHLPCFSVMRTTCNKCHIRALCLFLDFFGGNLSRLAKEARKIASPSLNTSHTFDLSCLSPDESCDFSCTAAHLDARTWEGNLSGISPPFYSRCSLCFKTLFGIISSPFSSRLTCSNSRSCQFFSTVSPPFPSLPIPDPLSFPIFATSLDCSFLLSAVFFRVLLQLNPILKTPL